jgi:YbbR domain-containing protein
MGMQVPAVIRDAFTRNRAIKFFSLLLALTLWFFVMGEKKAEFSFADVPVEFINKPPDMVVTGQSPRSVNLRVSGSRSLLATMSSGSLKAVMDLEGAKPGKMVFNDLSDAVKLPNGTKITSISPAAVELTLEALTAKQVPVTVDLQGEPASGYVVQGVSVEPPLVEVKVGESEAAQLQQLLTRPVDISGETKPVAREVPLVLTNLDPPRSVSKKKVQVAVAINSRIREKTLTGIPVIVVGSRHKARIVPETIQVRIQYPYQLEETVAAGGIIATIDMTDGKPGTYERQPAVKLPEGVSLLEAMPASCEVVLSKEPA